MSANVYSIESLLVGKIYTSKSIYFGERIVSAQKDERAVWYGENFQPYLVELESGKFRTVAVRVSDL
jgi:hypothetical protein